MDCVRFACFFVGRHAMASRAGLNAEVRLCRETQFVSRTVSPLRSFDASSVLRGESDAISRPGPYPEERLIPSGDQARLQRRDRCHLDTRPVSRGETDTVTRPGLSRVARPMPSRYHVRLERRYRYRLERRDRYHLKTKTV